jgi:ADP-heptose:LPS heptosyltransferase
VDYHPALDAILDTGSAALPVKSFSGFWRFVRQLRAGNFDLAVSLVRSPLMSAVLLLSGIPQRAGIDSAGRGFGYTLRVPVDPLEARHEAQIYLDVVAALGVDTGGIFANLPVLPEAQVRVQDALHSAGIKGRYLVLNPAGGSNPGMLLDSKRYPPQKFAAVANALAAELDAQIVLVAGPDDRGLITAVQQQLTHPAVEFAGNLSFPQIGALAAGALLYLGNDTGLTHLAAASGARTVMILGPSDPARYAPFTPDSLALWKPVTLRAGGVAAADVSNWDWERDGIAPEEVLVRVRDWLASK